MVRSTAGFISYDLRPAKQSERRILLDLLKTAGDCGLPIPDYRYIGMGANRFYDFLLIHKYLGIANMISLEHDPVMFERASFNCPYGFIKVLNKTATEFIATEAFENPSILWLDYDGGVASNIAQDISSLSPKLRVGDFCFVTVFGGPPGALARENSQARLRWFQDQLGDVAGDVTLADVENSSFPKAVHKVLIAAFRNAFAVRREGRFVPFLQVKYADSLPMITVGGGFLADGMIIDFTRRMKRVLPFLSADEPKYYQIQSLNLTERERVIFDRVTTRPSKRRTSQHNQLRKLGFDDGEIAAYKDLIRYLPRYVETIV